MSELLRVVISLSLSGGALTLLMAVLNRLLRRQMPVRFLYGLWLLVLLRFLCPFGTQASLAHRAVSQPQVTVILVVPESEVQPARPAAGAPVPQASPSAKQSAPASLPIPLLLTVVWGAGVLIAAGRRWGSYARLKRGLDREELPVKDWEREVFRALTAGNRRVPRLRRSAEADTPMLTGLFRPVVWLPAGTWSREDLGYALRHELTHARRHDLLFKWAAVGTACLHWFNPAAWYLVRAVERDGELSCDEAVSRTLSPEERTGYGELLLRCAMGQASRTRLLAASFKNQKQDLKARLTTIMRTQPDLKKARRLLAAVVVLVATVSASLGAYALSGTPEKDYDIQEGAVTLTTPQDDLDIAQAMDTLPILTSPDGNLWIGEDPAGDLMLSPVWDADLQTEVEPIYETALPSRNLEDLPKEFPLSWPFETDGQKLALSALFGERVHPLTGMTIKHDGIDIVLPQDTPVLAAAAGVVTESCYDDTLGIYVVLDHGNGLSTLYAHMSPDAVPQVGDQVETGEQIGAVSMTGSATGPHLHFEVREDGTLVDPVNYLPWSVIAVSFQSPDA